MERIYRTKHKRNHLNIGINIGITGTLSGIRGSLYLANSLYYFPIRSFSESSNLVTSSEQGCKDKKAEIYKKGFPAVFQDMSKMKEKKATLPLLCKIIYYYKKPAGFFSEKRWCTILNLLKLLSK